MSQVTYRANLSAKTFPFLSQNWGRTVIVPQYDNTFSRQLASSEDTDKDVGIPQIYYCHNVMPQAQGFQSVGYENRWVATSNPETFLRLLEYGPYYLGVTASGNVYIHTDAWYFLANHGPGNNITTATIEGQNYYYVAGVGCYIADPLLHTVTAITLTSLIPANILGIIASFGYLIAWSAEAVAWSSTIDPTDFTPSLVTGAGGGSVQEIKGVIEGCIPHHLGFFIYSNTNFAMAIASANVRYPFNFREVVNSGGIESIGFFDKGARKITHDPMGTNIYVYNSAGMQIISPAQAQTILPEITDFIGGKVFEDYNEVTKVFTSVAANFNDPQIKSVADRYLVISYGIIAGAAPYTHALVYDIILKRWGKLKISHVQCFEYSGQGDYPNQTPKNSIAFLQADGTVKTVTFNPNYIDSNGVLCLGKYQFVRQRILQLDEISLENIPTGTTPAVTILSSIDGKNPVTTVPAVLDANGLYRRYGSRAIGVNHSLVIQGSFTIVSVVMSFNIHGKR